MENKTIITELSLLKGENKVLKKEIEYLKDKIEDIESLLLKS